MRHDTMTWGEVAGRLSAARTYWLGTTMPSCAPHAAPVWGVVTGQTLYLYSERSTIKARNLAADPRIIVHLESGEDVPDRARRRRRPRTAVLGSICRRGPCRQVHQARRPAVLPSADPDFDVVYAVRPQSAMAWRLDDYAVSQRRWSSP
jgi:Pyridoxamine 5'-phosphate oxidase